MFFARTTTLAILCTGVAAQQPAPGATDLQAEVARMAEPLVAKDGRSGVVIGVYARGESRVFAFGRLSRKSETALDADTMFEIGSITKVFTGILLAQATLAGDLQLDDTAQSLLPAGVRMPRTTDHEIRLVDLATHFSGLPRLPDNLRAVPTNPYANYTPEAMYDFLGRCELRREAGAGYEYSNLGVGLLGHLLAQRADRAYEALVKERICKPLGMSDTTIALSKDQQQRLARAHLRNGIATLNWDIPTLAGAGALRSNVRDLLVFVAACAKPGDDPLGRAIALSMEPRRSRGKSQSIGLGWHIDGTAGREIIWHNGATGGYCSYLGLRPATGVGVVVLCNRQRPARGVVPSRLGTDVLRQVEDREAK